jgi:hypothetical protein
MSRDVGGVSTRIFPACRLHKAGKKGDYRAMNPPTEQLIRDYLNRVSVAARGRLTAEERRAFLARTREFIEQHTRSVGHTDADVLRLLSELGDPGALVDRERQRIDVEGFRSESAAPADQTLAARVRRLREAPANVASLMRASAAAVAPGDSVAVPEPADDNPLTGDLTVHERRPITSRWRPGEVIVPRQPRPRRAGFPRRHRPERLRDGGGLQQAPNAGDSATQEGLPGRRSGAPGSESGLLDTGQPDTGQPDTGQPDTRRPDTSQPDVGQTSRPAAAAPPLPADVGRRSAGPARPQWPSVAARRPAPDEVVRSNGQAHPPDAPAAPPDAPAGPVVPPQPGPPLAESAPARPAPASQPEPVVEPPAPSAEPAGAAGEGVDRSDLPEASRAAPADRAAGTPPPDEERPVAGTAMFGSAAEALGDEQAAADDEPSPVEIPPRGARVTWASGVRSRAMRAAGRRLAGVRPGGGRSGDDGQPTGPEDSAGRDGARPSGQQDLQAAASAAARRVARALAAWAKRHPLESAAVVVLGLGGLIYPPVWLMGAVIAMPSKIWDIRDKWVGMGFPFLLVIVAAVADATLAGGSHASLVSHLKAGWLFADHLSRIVALLGAAYLAWRAEKGRRQAPVPP